MAKPRPKRCSYAPTLQIVHIRIETTTPRLTDLTVTMSFHKPFGNMADVRELLASPESRVQSRRIEVTLELDRMDLAESSIRKS